jgi:hypothetical protein
MTTFNIQKNARTYYLIDNYSTLTYNDVLQHAMSYNRLNVRHAQKLHSDL